MTFLTVQCYSNDYWFYFSKCSEAFIKKCSIQRSVLDILFRSTVRSYISLQLNVASDVAFYSYHPDCLIFSLLNSFFSNFISLVVLSSSCLIWRCLCLWSSPSFCFSLLFFVQLFELIVHSSWPIARFSYSDRDMLD